MYVMNDVPEGGFAGDVFVGEAVNGASGRRDAPLRVEEMVQPDWYGGRLEFEGDLDNADVVSITPGGLRIEYAKRTVQVEMVEVEDHEVVSKSRKNRGSVPIESKLINRVDVVRVREGV
jgi:hypothetical protein